MSDYSPDTNSTTPSQATGQETGSEINQASESLRAFLRRIFDLQSNVHKTQTKEEIKENISFGGIQVYVLIASIVIASVGLNANSTAVVIGAMLISPLMGPIVGFGYSIAVNDFITLRKSLKNFFVMVVIALVTSYLYFKIVPGGDIITNELRGRIEPTILDVMIAVAGGFAGIVGASSKNKNVNVVAGVAIATALMPPLCTVGFGLAIGNDSIDYKDFTGFEAALNAFYLFFINSTFIALSTFFFIKLLRFPLAKYQDATKRRRINLIIIVTGIIVLIPSVFIFIGIFNSTREKFQIINFLNKEVAVNYSDSFIDLDKPKIEKTDSLTLVRIRSIGEIPPNAVKNWNREMALNYGIKNTKLVVFRGGGLSAEKLEELSEKNVQNLFQSTQQQIIKKDSTIQALNNQIARLQSDSIPFRSISKELKNQYKELDFFGYGNYNYTDFKKQEIVPTFALKWKSDSVNQLSQKEIKQHELRIKNYLKARLNLDTIRILH